MPADASHPAVDLRSCGPGWIRIVLELRRYQRERRDERHRTFSGTDRPPEGKRPTEGHRRAPVPRRLSCQRDLHEQELLRSIPGRTDRRRRLPPANSHGLHHARTGHLHRLSEPMKPNTLTFPRLLVGVALAAAAFAGMFFLGR